VKIALVVEAEGMVAVVGAGATEGVAVMVEVAEVVDTDSF